MHHLLIYTDGHSNDEPELTEVEFNNGNGNGNDEDGMTEDEVEEIVMDVLMNVTVEDFSAEFVNGKFIIFCVIDSCIMCSTSTQDRKLMLIFFFYITLSLSFKTL